RSNAGARTRTPIELAQQQGKAAGDDMKIDLKGRIALVTGSTGGIGRAIAETLARAGAEVIVNGLEAARVDAVAAQLETRGIAADVGTSAGAQHIFDRVPRVDILVNNVGVFKAEPAFDIDDDGWRR